MEHILGKYKNFFYNKEKKIEEKNESELTVFDRYNMINIDNFDNKIINKIIDLDFKTKDNIKIQDRVYEDLEIFNNIKNDTINHGTIYNKINNTQTTMGHLTLKNILLNPINNIGILEQRQDIIKKYLSLPTETKNKIKELLLNIKSLEKDIKWFWDDNIQKHLYVLYDIVFLNLTGINKIDNFLNKNRVLLSIFNVYRIFLAPIINILSPLSTVLIPFVLFLVFKKFIPVKITNKQFFSMIFKNFFNSDIVGILLGKTSFKQKMFGIISAGIWIFIYIQNVYSSVKLSKNVNNIINLIHSKLNSIKKLINNTNLLNKLCSNLKLNILNVDINKFNNNCNSLSCIFTKDCFDCKPKLFSNKGVILSTYQIFDNMKNNIKNILRYVGVIDYINSNSILINKYISNNKYVFPEYNNNNKKPSMNFTGIWNPYLSDKPVLNDININKNIILTGPNAAGKSTFIKSVAINVILSQSIGISSCSNLNITPFKIVDTYLQIPDIKGNSSLFEAEMIRSKSYINTLKNSDDFSFIIMDEIFSSTNYIEGFSGAYAILNKISKFDKSMFIATTHYGKLSTLKNKSKNIINYKFTINRDTSNNIKFNYKIKKGVSKQFIALELLKNNNFDDDIISEALAISKKIRLKHKK